MATHSCVLAWKIPWAEELGGCSPRGCTELDATEHMHRQMHLTDKESKAPGGVGSGPQLPEAKWLVSTLISVTLTLQLAFFLTLLTLWFPALPAPWDHLGSCESSSFWDSIPDRLCQTLRGEGLGKLQFLRTLLL